MGLELLKKMIIFDVRNFKPMKIFRLSKFAKINKGKFEGFVAFECEFGNFARLDVLIAFQMAILISPWHFDYCLRN